MKKFYTVKTYVLLAFCISLLWVGGIAIADEAITFPNPLGNVNDFPTLIQNVATYITVIVGALAVLMFIWAGILFITAAMFPGNYEKGKNALWWAMIGLIIALSAMGLIQVVRQVLGGQQQEGGAPGGGAPPGGNGDDNDWLGTIGQACSGGGDPSRPGWDPFCTPSAYCDYGNPPRTCKSTFGGPCANNNHCTTYRCSVNPDTGRGACVQQVIGGRCTFDEDCESLNCNRARGSTCDLRRN